jgi:Ca-activated chloride channel homolog
MKIKIIVLLVIAVFVWQRFFSGNEAEMPAYDEVNLADTYAMRGVDYSWPGVSQNNQPLASNKLAKNYYFVFDGSGSMEHQSCESADSKIAVAKQALSAFFGTLAADVNVGMFLFDNNGAGEVLPISALNTPKLERVIEQIRAGGGTPLGASMRKAYQSLSQQALRQQGYGEYNLVVITDGEANDGDVMNAMVSQITQQSSVNIHTLGFCLSGDHALNVRGVVNYISANNAEQLLQGLKNVTAEAESFDIRAFDGV